MNRQKCFRALSWLKYVLTLVMLFLVWDIVKTNNEAMTMNNNTMKKTIWLVDQNFAVEKRLKQIVDAFSVCSEQKKYLDANTGECK